MNKRIQISLDEAKRIGDCLYVNWEQVDLHRFRQGLMGNVRPGAREAEPGPDYEGVLLSGKAVLAHMQEIPDYVMRLARLRAEVRQYGMNRRQQNPDEVDIIQASSDRPDDRLDRAPRHED